MKRITYEDEDGKRHWVEAFEMPLSLPDGMRFISDDEYRNKNSPDYSDSVYAPN